MSKIDEKGYTKEFINLDELHTRLSKINYDINDGIIIEITCSDGQILKIPGIEDFSKDCQIEKIPRFEIKISNSNNEELKPDTKIKLLKNKVLRKDVELCELSYKDISTTNFNESFNKYKLNKEIFRFKKQIVLKSKESLKFKIIDSNIKVENIKFNLGLYLLYKDE
jgi:hypothetical protein